MPSPPPGGPPPAPPRPPRCGRATPAPRRRARWPPRRAARPPRRARSRSCSRLQPVGSAAAVEAPIAEGRDRQRGEGGSSHEAGAGSMVRVGAWAMRRSTRPDRAAASPIRCVTAPSDRTPSRRDRGEGGRLGSPRWGGSSWRRRSPWGGKEAICKGRRGLAGSPRPAVCTRICTSQIPRSANGAGPARARTVGSIAGRPSGEIVRPPGAVPTDASAGRSSGRGARESEDQHARNPNTRRLRRARRHGGPRREPHPRGGEELGDQEHQDDLPVRPGRAEPRHEPHLGHLHGDGRDPATTAAPAGRSCPSSRR